MGQDDKFRSFSASARELADAWKDRLEDANALFSSGRNAAAISSGLYAIEILLKTRALLPSEWVTLGHFSVGHLDKRIF